MFSKICYQVSCRYGVISYMTVLVLHVCMIFLWIWKILRIAFSCYDITFLPCRSPCPLDQAPPSFPKQGDSRGTGSGRHQRGQPHCSGPLLCRHSCCASPARPVATCILQSTWRHRPTVPFMPSSSTKGGARRWGLGWPPGLYSHFYCLDTVTFIFWVSAASSVKWGKNHEKFTALGVRRSKVALMSVGLRKFFSLSECIFLIWSHPYPPIRPEGSF